jgi:hypothetical protein
MSYVINGVTYDEAGRQIDAFGHPLGGTDPNVGQNQPLSSFAAAAHTTVSALEQSHPVPRLTAPVMARAPLGVAAPPRALPLAIPGNQQLRTMAPASILASPMLLVGAILAGAWIFRKSLRKAL